MPRCCGTVFHREACPGATGELGSCPGGAPGPGVPEERRGEAGAAMYTRIKEGQVLGHPGRQPLLVGEQGPGLWGPPGDQRVATGRPWRRTEERENMAGSPVPGPEIQAGWACGGRRDYSSKLCCPSLGGTPSCPSSGGSASPGSGPWGHSLESACLPRLSPGRASPPSWVGRAATSGSPELRPDLAREPQGPCPLAALQAGLQPPTVPWEES